ncbi:hypothetical protein HGRIS_004468 [Hohenbuehelia grisea]|uniref:GST N-terminal domain-containing protein n=1 Tax=Hohenbuehelia grisea TaxID=104357 RepID=A0ABR3JC48_9AGAR
MISTLPMIRDPTQLASDGKPIVLAESYAIIKYLDRTYPDKPVIPEGTDALQTAWMKFVWTVVVSKISPIYLPRGPSILSERAKEYFIRTRNEWLGPLDKMCPDEDKAWAEVEEGFSQVAAALDVNGVEEGRNLQVIPGQTSYADFVVLGVLLWGQTVISQEKLDEIRNWNGGRWGKILDMHKDLTRIV